MSLLKGPRLTGSAGWPGARVAVVTGAGRGVGRGEAIDLARNGWCVVVNDLDTVHAETDGAAGRSADTVVREIVQAGGQAVADYNDVADPNGADALISTALSTFGGLDAVVNNAGVLRSQPFLDMPPATFDEVLHVSLHAQIEPCRAAGLYWRQSPDAPRPRRIINTTSNAGYFGGTGATTAYTTAKAGVVGLTLALARELSPLGVTVNAIAPRALTRLSTNSSLKGKARFSPDQIAPFVTWLASEHSGSLTGRLFVVGGGDLFVLRPYEALGPYSLSSRDGLEAPAPDTDTSFPGTLPRTAHELTQRFG
jgi:NAD(P)-dependent dehydrogenase (short-subunit alcohol dehydrogenase family)